MSTTTATRPTAIARLPVRSLALLSAGVLVTVTAEALPAGLLPEMSVELRVSPLQVGLLISVWALTVIVTSLPLARATARFDRRLVGGGALVVFALANLATAAAPSFELALATRIAAAVAHGVFWAVVIVYATAFLTPSHLGRGLAIVTAGGTAASVVGLPVGTLLAQTVGWRAVFVVFGAMALGLGLVIMRAMPRHLPSPPAHSRRRGVGRDPSLPALLLFGGAAVLIAMAQFASFTYIRPYLEVAASFEASWAAGLLFVYGAAGFGGVAAAGMLANRAPRTSLIAVLALFAVAFGTLTLAPGSAPAVVGGLLAWGFALGAIFPLLQATLMRVVTERTRTLASAGIVVLFNVGIAVGPWLGGVLGGERTPTLNTGVSALAMLVAVALGVVGVVVARTRLAVSDGRGPTADRVAERQDAATGHLDPAE